MVAEPESAPVTEKRKKKKRRIEEGAAVGEPGLGATAEPADAAAAAVAMAVAAAVVGEAAAGDQAEALEAGPALRVRRGRRNVAGEEADEEVVAQADAGVEEPAASAVSRKRKGRRRDAEEDPQAVTEAGAKDEEVEAADAEAPPKRKKKSRKTDVEAPDAAQEAVVTADAVEEQPERVKRTLRWAGPPEPLPAAPPGYVLWGVVFKKAEAVEAAQAVEAAAAAAAVAAAVPEPAAAASEAAQADQGKRNKRKTSEAATVGEVPAAGTASAAECLKVCAAKLPQAYSKTDIWRRFSSRCGPVTDVHLLWDWNTDSSKGVSFITFEDAKGVQAALDLDGTEIEGCRIRVNLAVDKPSDGKGKDKGKGKGHGKGDVVGGKGKCFTPSYGKGKGKGKAAALALGDIPLPEAGCPGVIVKGLPFSVTEAEIKEFFVACSGGPSRIRVLLDRSTGESRGTAFVDFDGNMEGSKAARRLSGQELKGRRLFVQYARPKPETAEAAS